MGQRELWEELYRRSPRAWRGTSDVPIPCSGRALDIGCGNGKTSSALLEAGLEVVGIDFSASAVAKCSELYPSGRFVECDASDLPFPDGSFDYVLAVHVLENMDDSVLGPAVSEMRRVLAPGGYAFARCFTPDDMRSGSGRNGLFYRYFDEDGLCALFDGMEKVSSRRTDSPTRFGGVRSRAECLFRKG